MGKVNVQFKYSCETCGKKFRTVKQKSNHYNNNPGHKKQDDVNTQEASQVEGKTIVHTVLLIFCFLTILSTIEPTPIVYNVKSSDSANFNNSELGSIQFRDICDTYSIPREGQRELIYLFRTMLKINEDSYKANPLGMYLYSIFNFG